MQTFIAELKEIIQARHMLTHPFYRHWEAGTLPIEVMRKYAEQYYHLEKNFPKFLSATHSQCDDPADRQAITDNLYDEEHGQHNHRELWLRFAEAIGATRTMVEQSSPLPETQSAINTFRRLSQSSAVEGAAGLAAYESQIPTVAESKLRGLAEHYAIVEKSGTDFFRVHSVLDIEHANAWWKMIEKHANGETERDRVRQAVKAGRDALWQFLDGVMRAYFPAHAA